MGDGKKPFHCFEKRKQKERSEYFIVFPTKPKCNQMVGEGNSPFRNRPANKLKNDEIIMSPFYNPE
jgi:hypothetical protein